MRRLLLATSQYCTFQTPFTDWFIDFIRWFTFHHTPSKMGRVRRQRPNVRALSPPFLCLSVLSSCFLNQSFRVHAFVPPHPDSGLAEQWESVHHYRRRLGNQCNYMPRFVHPELCRYLNDQECQDVDASLHDHATRHRSLWETYNKASFHDPVEDSHGVPSSNNNGGGTTIRRNPYSVAPDDPVIKVLVVLMRFQDHRDRELPPKEEYEMLWNERIHRWFHLNSYGNYRFHATVTDWMDTDATEIEYADGVSGVRYNLQQAFWPILDQLNDNPAWDWSRFDGNKDGKLDAVVVLHSGYPAEVGGYDCTNQRPVADRIWSHAFASSFSWSTQGILHSDEFQTFDLHQQPQQNSAQSNTTEQNPSVSAAEPLYVLHGYVIASGLNGTCGSDVANMGVMVHEYMHTLGLDDVYDYGTDSPGKGIGMLLVHCGYFTTSFVSVLTLAIGN
jgi:M6 family metalloprotease-like protein